MGNNLDEHQGYILQERIPVGKYIFSIAHNPNAVDPYVVWQSNKDTPQEYYWGKYAKNEHDALKNMHSRIVGEVRDVLQRIDSRCKRLEMGSIQRMRMERSDGR